MKRIYRGKLDQAAEFLDRFEKEHAEQNQETGRIAMRGGQVRPPDGFKLAWSLGIVRAGEYGLDNQGNVTNAALRLGL